MLSNGSVIADAPCGRPPERRSPTRLVAPARTAPGRRPALRPAITSPAPVDGWSDNTDLYVARHGVPTVSRQTGLRSQGGRPAGLGRGGRCGYGIATVLVRCCPHVDRINMGAIPQGYRGNTQDPPGRAGSATGFRLSGQSTVHFFVGAVCPNTDRSHASRQVMVNRSFSKVIGSHT